MEQEHAFAVEHELFIDSLIERNLALLGGAFAAPVAGADAAYLLRCGGVEEARAIAAEVRRSAGREPGVRPVQVVAINPDAVIRPQDV